MADIETLLGASAVYIFGRPLSDLTIKPDIYNTVGLQSNGSKSFFRNQMEHKEAALARIFAFSFEGALFELARPTIFLVHGAGRDPNEPAPTNAQGNIELDRLSRAPGSSAFTGLGLQSGAFALGMRVWAYDKGDVSMRLDIDTGTFEQILLSAEASIDPRGALARGGGGLARGGGALARGGGALARGGGVMARGGGWMAGRPGDSD